MKFIDPFAGASRARFGISLILALQIGAAGRAVAARSSHPNADALSQASEIAEQPHVQHSIYSCGYPGVRQGWRAQWRAGLGITLALFVSATAAQSYEVHRGDLVLRGSTVTTASIDAATAARHGIEVSPRRALLNVVVLRGAPRKPVAADVTAASHTLAGVREDIRMESVRENGRVSYLGSYDFVPGEVLDFDIRARPLRPAKGRPLSLSFRQQMPRGTSD